MSTVVTYGNIKDDPGFFVCAIRDLFAMDEMSTSEVLAFERYSTLEEATAYADIAVVKYGALGPHRVINDASEASA